MHFHLFRPAHWPIALGLVALAASCALDGPRSLNPQPLPPEQAGPPHGDDAGLSAGSGSNSPAGSSGSSSGAGLGGLDSGSAQSDAPATPSIAGDASADGGNRSTADGGSDGGGAAEDAASDAPPPSDAAEDAASDAPPPGDAATDGSDASDGGCMTRWDCHASFPDECNICASPLNYLACVSGACVCACRVMDAAGE
jgi:hypothetical protein